MSLKLVHSLVAFHLIVTGTLTANSLPDDEVHQEEIGDDEIVAEPKEAKGPLADMAHRARSHSQITLDMEKRAAAQSKAVVQTEENKPEPRKKLKAHFAGSKRPAQNAPDYVAPPKTKKSTRIKNQWVSSKTHPKIVAEEAKGNQQRSSSSQNKTAFGEGNALKSSRRASPYFASDKLIADAGADDQMPMKKTGSSEEKLKNEGEEYPHLGFIAPDGHIYVAGEWIYWRTREGGLEYAVERSSNSPGVYTDAVSKKLNIDWQSGFRVGLGVHLPYDGWDIFVNYTDFRPDESSHASGSVFPLLVYQGQFPVSNVTDAHGHWKIDFQTLDVEVGRAYYIGKSLILRPNIGIRGAWIDQHAHFTYKGGDIPSGQEYSVSDKNDFKGAGIRAGINSNWYFGAGISFNCDLFASLVAGHFDLSQDQKQLDVEVIDLDTDLNQISPNAQLFLGLSWDRNFYHNKCHFGLTVGFETQYWWRQNQIEHFTDSSQPIFVRPDDDLAFYGIDVKLRFDF